jgi:hypothetical protein
MERNGQLAAENVRKTNESSLGGIRDSLLGVVEGLLS